MFQFHWPWLALLLPLPLLCKWFFPSVKNSLPAAQLYFPAIDRLKQAFSSFPLSAIRASSIFFLWLSAVWFFLVMALMQPEMVDQYRQIKNKGYDIILAVDISASMQAVDFSTPGKVISRLDVTKEVVGKFVRGRGGDRLGLVAFGEKAYLHVPLTLDTAAISGMLNDTVSGMAGNATAIGDAIGVSVRTLRERPEGSRVIILLTDGEDNASSIPPMEAAKLAKQYGIHIYTIGIGKDGPVPFPTGYGGYGMVEVAIDEGLLKEIATATGGLYFRATDKQALEAIYNQINELVKSEANQTLFLIREPLYYYPLAIAIALLLLLSLVQLLFWRAPNGI